jgi:hypothetical protein
LSGLVGALILAAVGAIGSGLGNDITSLFSSGPTLISYSAAPVIVQCGTSLFVSGSRAKSGRLPVTSDWPAFKRSTGAAVVSPGVVTVSIQGETSRPITLTGIDFTVVRRNRPDGGAFAAPCGSGVQGRFIEADLDRTPAAVVSSSREPSGVLGATRIPGHRPNKPIEFPWSVSLTDPLLLDIVATTKRCFCTWRARISWQSGDKTGVIAVDNGGQGYSVVGGDGVRTYLQGNSKWQPFKGRLDSFGGGD